MERQKFAPLYILLLLVIVSCTKKAFVYNSKNSNYTSSSAPSKFTHPGVGLNSYDLAKMKANINIEPWKSGYAVLSRSPQASINYIMQGPFATVGREPDLNLSQYQNDMQAVLYQAIQYYITGNATYAKKVIQILNAWTTTHTKWSGGTPFLAATDDGLNMILGAEILRYNYPGWTSAETTNCINYSNNVLWPQFSVGPDVTLRSANQGAAQLKGAMAVAVFCDDINKYNEVINSWHDDSCGGFVGTSLSTGQIADSGRDQGHALGEIQNLALVAEIAWKQNLDLFGELDNRMKTEMEYFCSYNLGNYVPFTTFGACYGLYNTIGNGGRGTFSWAPAACEIINGAYAVRKGIENPYTTQYLATLTPNPDTFLWRKDSLTPRTAPPASTWIAPVNHTVAVTNLLDGDIGSVGIGGGAIYDNGTWTVKGSGVDIWGTSDSFNFVYKQITGDGTIIARVTGQDNTNVSAKAGIMIRETLNADSKFSTIYMKQNFGAEFIQRSATGGSYSNLQSHTLANPLPYWLMLVRKGDYITGFNSMDGVTWTPMRMVYAPMSSTVYIGLDVCAHNNSALNTSTFTNVGLRVPN